MRRIDLTVDGAFSNDDTNIGNIRITNSSGININIDNQLSRAINRLTISESEIETNFLTGSLDDIKEKEFSLRAMRSLEEINPICDKCGIDLVFSINKDNTLCSECDIELEQEFKQNRMIEILFK